MMEQKLQYRDLRPTPLKAGAGNWVEPRLSGGALALPQVSSLLDIE